MSNLATVIMLAYVEEGLSNFNLFVNSDGVFQCNVSHRDTHSYAIGRATNPVTAIEEGISKALKAKQKAERKAAAEKPKRRSAEDML